VETCASQKFSLFAFSSNYLYALTEYAKAIGFPDIDADYFCQRYAADDWHLANGKKMKSWKRSVVTWKKNSAKYNYQAEDERPAIHD
jgi:hypothetical protein